MAPATLHADVLDASMDAVITVDSDGLILRWNAAAVTMFGYTADEVLGHELGATIVPEDLRASHRVGLARFAAGAPAEIVGGRTETVGQRSNGSLFPVELTITRVSEGDSVVFVGFLRDITERQLMLAELRDSRARLMTVSDDTRRRVERDLHDGAQQQLVALAISLSLARQQVEADPTQASATLDQSVAILTSAIDELRDLARGVHSGILTGRGLSAAITHLARRSPIDVTVEVESVGRLPTLVETSVYYLVAEALTNATKYGAKRVWIDLRLDRGDGAGQRLVATITDDGPGGADPSKGTGLAGMTERLHALGGTVEIESGAGIGTKLSIDLPVSLSVVPAPSAALTA
jgi:PAS domain S-box-containing protein